MACRHRKSQEPNLRLVGQVLHPTGHVNNMFVLQWLDLFAQVFLAIYRAPILAKTFEILYSFGIKTAIPTEEQTYCLRGQSDARPALLNVNWVLDFSCACMPSVALNPKAKVPTR